MIFVLILLLIIIVTELSNIRSATQLTPKEFSTFDLKSAILKDLEQTEQPTEQTAVPPPNRAHRRKKPARKKTP